LAVRLRASGGGRFCDSKHDSWSGLINGRQKLSRPPTPFTIDWERTHASIKELASSRPNVAGCGHGVPISASDLPGRMQAFAENFHPPQRGRYVRRPAQTDENGIVDLSGRHLIRFRWQRQQPFYFSAS
jgi:hypothetical protein